MLDQVLEYYGMTEEDLIPKRRRRKYGQMTGNSQVEMQKTEDSAEGTQTEPKQRKQPLGMSKKTESDQKSKKKMPTSKLRSDQRPRGKGKEPEGSFLVENSLPENVFDPPPPQEESDFVIPHMARLLEPGTDSGIKQPNIKAEDCGNSQGCGTIVKGSSSDCALMTKSKKPAMISKSNTETSITYGPGYYLTGAATAGIAAIVGLFIYAWTEATKSRQNGAKVVGRAKKTNDKQVRRLHGRDWQVVQ